MSTDELPEGWLLSDLQSLGAWSTGGTPSRKQPEFFGGPIPWVKSGDLPDGLVESTEESITELAIQASNAKLLSKGTLAVALYGATIGKLGILGIPAATNQACASCQVNGTLAETKLLFYYLLEQRQKLIEAGQGGAQPNISNAIVREWQIPLPPLAEQRRIVAAVERILGRVNAARARLDRVPTTLKRFRQAVLAAACSGRLTADWRIGGDSFHQTSDEMPEIPTSWEYKPSAEIVEPGTVISYGIVLPGPNLDDGVPYVRGQDIIDSGEVLVDQLWRTSQAIADKHKRSVLMAGDVLLCVIRHLRVAIVPKGLDGANLTQGTVRLRPSEEIDRHFLAYFLQSPQSQEWMKARYIGMAMPRINVEHARQIPVPIPPLAEQQEIVKRVSALFARADAIEAAVTAARKRVDTLTQAVLAKAFRGELVPTEAELARRENRPYEPAADLLARLRATNEATPAKHAGRRKATRPNVAVVDMLAFVALTATDAGPLNRTKVQKFAAVLQEHHGVPVVELFLQGQFGPYSPEIEAAEPEGEKQGYFTVQKIPKEKGGFEVQYPTGPNAEAGRLAALNRLGDHADAAERLLRTIRRMTTDETELFATIYTVWKELLLDGKPTNEKTITAGVYGWHDEKRKFTPETIRQRMTWMREAGYIPTGDGRPTTPAPQKPTGKRTRKPNGERNS